MIVLYCFIGWIEVVCSVPRFKEGFLCLIIGEINNFLIIGFLPCRLGKDGLMTTVWRI